MPFEKFRTHTQPVNLRRPRGALRRGGRGDPGLAARGRPGHAPRGAGQDARPGRAQKALTVHAHGFSKTAREKIEAAGGTCQLIEE